MGVAALRKCKAGSGIFYPTVYGIPARGYAFVQGQSRVKSRAFQTVQHGGYAGFFGVAALLLCACVGATAESPSAMRNASREQGVPAISSDISRLLAPAVHGPTATPSAANLSSRNLQRPRLPRHRSERPSLGVSDAEAVTSLVVKAMLGDDVYRALVGEWFGACPLAGHPLALLRPPSLAA